VAVGATLTYTITVTNNGPSTATGVTLTDTLPASVSFFSASPGCGLAGNIVTCGLGTLLNGDSAIVTITVTTTAPGAITNTATVAGNEPDPTSANNAVSVVNQVGSFAAIPTLSEWGSVALVLLLAAAGFALLLGHATPLGR
jgi:uncharacterized repeat protein (TIGR01451 family)